MIKKSFFLFLFSSATSLFFVVVGLVRDAAVCILFIDISFCVSVFTTEVVKQNVM